MQRLESLKLTQNINKTLAIRVRYTSLKYTNKTTNKITGGTQYQTEMKYEIKEDDKVKPKHLLKDEFTRNAKPKSIICKV